MNYGDTADYDQNNFVSVVWKNNDKTAGADGNSHNAILGDAPQLQFNFNPPEDVCTIETPVNVTSVISPTNTHTNHRVPENTEIITHTTFHREACTICGYSGKVCGEQCVKIEEGTPNFIVHLNSFDLVITKVVNGKIDDGQSFLFNVNGPGFSGDVVISKFTYDEDNKKTTGSVTVKSLTAGEYTIEELIDWSWRYKIADGSSLTQTITSANGNTSVTFTNEREDIYWLSGDSIAKNWWGDGLVERTETAIIEALSSGN